MEPGRTELGFLPLGVGVNLVDDEGLTVVPVPAGGIVGTVARGVYLQYFATDTVAIEPQLSATGVFGGDDIASGSSRAARA